MNRDFTKKVIQVVKNIPKGEILSYKEVAVKAGSPRAYRVVGNIMKNNSDKKVPCHRVIKSDGSLGDYRWGKNRKRELLKKEKAIS